MKKLVLALAVCAALVAASFATAAGMPSVHFVAPMAGAKTGSTVTFRVKLTNFKLDAADVGKTKKANMGHLHFQMDGGKYDYPKYSGANGKIAVQLGVQGKYSPSLNNKVTYTGLPKGKHKVTVFLVRNNHANYPNKAAKRTITFTVK